MGLKWQSIYVECGSTMGPRELHRPFSLPSCAAHHPIQMKCKSLLSPIPTMSIPLTPAQPTSIQHLSSLDDSFPLSYNTLSFFPSLLFLPLATCHFIYLFIAYFPLFCAARRLQPSEKVKFYHSKVNKSIVVTIFE